MAKKQTPTQAIVEDALFRIAWENPGMEWFPASDLRGKVRAYAVARDHPVPTTPWPAPATVTAACRRLGVQTRTRKVRREVLRFYSTGGSTGTMREELVRDYRIADLRQAVTAAPKAEV